MTIEQTFPTSDDDPEEYHRSPFVIAFDEFQATAHETAVTKGFWDSQEAFTERMEENDNYHALLGLIHAGRLALIHSEISEALEAARDRTGEPWSTLGKGILQEEEELADAIIRIVDYAEARGFHLGRTIVAKMEKNAKRAYKHGKNF